MSNIDKNELMPVEKTPWAYYSVVALTQWLKYDRKGAAAIEHADHAELRRLMSYYRIARNFKGLANADTLDKLIKPLQQLSGLAHSGANPLQCVADQVEWLTSVWMKKCGVTKSLVSAASKMIYLHRPMEGIIYDRNAVTALGQSSAGSYAAFIRVWELRLAAARGDILTACQYCCTQLPDSALPLHLATASQCREILQWPWFYRRIFDTYLWHVGAVQG